MYTKLLDREVRMESIISALIAGGLALVGVVITNITANSKIEQQLAMAQAVTDTKLENLTSEVRKHNTFSERIPVLENRVTTLESIVRELQYGSTNK